MTCFSQHNTALAWPAGLLGQAARFSLSQRVNVSQRPFWRPWPCVALYADAESKHNLKHSSERDAIKEESRKYRRTHFSHNKWAAHRSTNRYWRHLKSGVVSSRIVRGLGAPLLYVAIVSFAVCCYETALKAGELPDWGFCWASFSGNFAGPFSWSTFALSLLLVFRTNSSYQRWCEARKLWGLLINRSRDIARQALQFCSHTEADVAAAICRWTVAFSYTLMCLLREDVQLEPSLAAFLQLDEQQLILQQQHKGSAVLQALGACVRASSMKEIHKMRIDENITIMQDVMGGCERIFRTPIPLSYTRHTSRFLVCWLTCLPFCVADTVGWATVPVACGLAFFLFGIEEIGVQIEEPFGILALEVFCETIAKNVSQAEAQAASSNALAAKCAGRAADVTLEQRQLDWVVSTQLLGANPIRVCNGCDLHNSFAVGSSGNGGITTGSNENVTTSSTTSSSSNSSITVNELQNSGTNKAAIFKLRRSLSRKGVAAAVAMQQALNNSSKAVAIGRCMGKPYTGRPHAARSPVVSEDAEEQEYIGMRLGDDAHLQEDEQHS